MRIELFFREHVFIVFYLRPNIRERRSKTELDPTVLDKYRQPQSNNIALRNLNNFTMVSLL